MTITPNTRLHDLLEAYPFLVEFLVKYNPKFGLLNSRITRAAMGRLATLRKVAVIGGVPVDRLLADIAAAVAEKTGTPVKADASAPDEGKEERVAELKGVIEDLHRGVPFDKVKERFDSLIGGVEHAEIAAMEEQLIREGMPASEIQNLCDLHVGVIKSALDKKQLPRTEPGHPVHTCMAENEAVTAAVEDFDRLVTDLSREPSSRRFQALKGELERRLSVLAQVETHYVRKENQIFPFLEKHGITAPPQVMWGVHDEIRAQLKDVRAAIRDGRVPDLLDKGPRLGRAVVEMVYKESHVLFPLALETFTPEEWAAIRKGDDEIGYAFVKPAAAWPAAGAAAGTAVSAPAAAAMGVFPFDTGELTLEQANLILTHLPVDVTFVDEKDEVRFFSAGKERVFARSPGIIGRKVQNCHPPKSLDAVNRIVAAFRKGEKDVAEFWIPMKGMFVHIRYFAVRDSAGRYRGCLEVTQEISAIRNLQGERRLLDWE